MAIQSPMLGNQMDSALKQINDAQNTDNNGLILYIRQGQLAFDTYENLFTIIQLEPEGE